MKFSEMYASEGQYLSKGDLPVPRTATIANVYHEQVKGQHGSKTECVVSFTDAGIKPLILNVTNGNTIMNAYGEDIDKLRGRVIEVYHDPNVEYPAGTKVGGVRVRIPSGPAPAPTAAPAGGNPLTFEQAQSYAAEVGISKDEIVAKLKAAGMTSWAQNPGLATSIVHKLVDDVRANAGGPTGDEIPF